MRYIRPSVQDMLGTLPPGEQAELIGLITAAAAADRRWVAIPPPAWAALAANVRATAPRGGTP